MKYFVLGALASGLLLYGMSMIYGATGSLDLDEVVERRSRSGSVNHARCWCSAWCSSSPASRSSSAPCRSTCGSRTSTRARRRAVTLLIGAAPEARRVRDRASACWSKALHGAGARLAADAGAARRAVDGARQPHRDRADRTSSACSPIRRSRTWASCCSACCSGVVDGNWLNRRSPTARRCSTSIIYVLMTLGAFGMLLLLSRAGLRVREPRRLQGPQPPQPVVRAAS